MSNRVLIITSNTSDASTLKDVLEKAQDGPFVLEVSSMQRH